MVGELRIYYGSSRFCCGNGKLMAVPNACGGERRRCLCSGIPDIPEYKYRSLNLCTILLAEQFTASGSQFPMNIPESVTGAVSLDLIDFRRLCSGPAVSVF